MDIFPQNEYIPEIKNSPEAIEGFVQRFLVAKDETSRRYGTFNMFGARKMRKKGKMVIGEEYNSRGLKLPPRTGYQGEYLQYHLDESPAILVCGHQSRDSRCGTLGPILKAEVRNWLRHELGQSTGRPYLGKSVDQDLQRYHPLRNTRVALISHVGGHAFAGNLVIYIPPAFKIRDVDEVSPLAGKGVWYGRVEPRHIEGIMEETVKGGRIIQELLRGIHYPIQGNVERD